MSVILFCFKKKGTMVEHFLLACPTNAAPVNRHILDSVSKHKY